MLTIWIAIFLGLTQGLTEFLPVSSSGHLMLAERFFGIMESSLMFSLILHLATLCAVVIVFRKKIWELIKHPLNKTNYNIIIATIISCSLVLIFKDYIDRAFTFYILPFTFLITAIILLIVSFFRTTPNITKDGTTVTYKTSIFAGIIQGIAVIPGISRSGATISAALATGTSREEAAEFSFLMSIPIIVASFTYELISSPESLGSIPFFPMLVAFLTAFVAGIFAIKIMLAVVKKIQLYWFSIYLTALSILLLIIQFT